MSRTLGSPCIFIDRYTTGSWRVSIVTGRPDTPTIEPRRFATEQEAQLYADGARAVMGIPARLALADAHPNQEPA